MKQLLIRTSIFSTLMALALIGPQVALAKDHGDESEGRGSQTSQIVQSVLSAQTIQRSGEDGNEHRGRGQSSSVTSSTTVSNSKGDDNEDSEDNEEHGNSHECKVPHTSLGSIISNLISNRHGDDENDNDDNDDNCVPAPVTLVITNVASTPSDISAMITWMTNASSTSKVFYSTSTPVDVNSSSTLNVSNASLVTNHSLMISGLTASTTYHFVVASTDASNNTTFAPETTFTTTATPVVVDITPPIISATSTTASTSTISVTWLTDELASSKVFFSTTTPVDLNASTTLSVETTTLSLSHSLILSGLIPSTTYHLIIASTDASGNPAFSPEISVTTNPTDTTAPVISSVFATISSNSVMFTWLTNESATSKVFYSTSTPVNVNSTSTLNVASTTLLTNHSITIPALTANTLYHFVISSTDASNNTQITNEFNLTTLP